MWKREGFFYVARLLLIKGNGFRVTRKNRLDFVSYHLIKWIHGEEALREMAMRQQ